MRVNTIAKRRSAQPHEFFALPLSEFKERPWNDRDLKIRELGQRLHELGGIELMREVWWTLREQQIYVGARWDGIGGWYA